jgi:hypothetical protein
MKIVQSEPFRKKRTFIYFCTYLLAIVSIWARSSVDRFVTVTQVNNGQYLNQECELCGHVGSLTDTILKCINKRQGPS